MRALEVYLYGKLAGRIVENSRGARFQYCPEVVEAHAGRPLLSLALPVKKRAFGESKTRNWFEGLLPEGQRRERICRQLGISPYDWLGLLSQIGWECAGAVQVFLEGEVTDRGSSRRPLDTQDLIAQLNGISSRQPEPNLGSFRLSLGGYQDKLCVSMPPLENSARINELADVALPQGDAPSTHILKPEPIAYPGMAESEAWAMDLAGSAARCSKTALLTLEGAPQTFIAERYDRKSGPSNSIKRLHQEDACQALDLAIERKYATEHEQKGDDPTYKKIADLLTRFSSNPQLELEELLRQLTVNLVLGNWDAHAKNISFLYAEPMNPMLAPMYDVVPIAEIEPRTKLLSMRVNGKLDFEETKGESLVAEATSWGLKKDEATKVILAALDAMETHMPQAAEQFPKAAARHEANAKTRAVKLRRGL